MMAYKRVNGLPILKCGDSKDLVANKIGHLSVTLKYTCPFDSIFQILLVAACDFPLINDKLNIINFLFFRVLIENSTNYYYLIE